MNNQAKNLLGLVLFVMVLGAGCGRGVDTANGLATALKRNGIEYQVIEPVDFDDFSHAKIDESIALKGDNLWVEILRIEDEKTYKLFVVSWLLLGAAETKVQQRLPGRPDIYSKRPFVIIIRKEPQKGHVKEVLKRILPEQEG